MAVPWAARVGAHSGRGRALRVLPCVYVPILLHAVGSDLCEGITAFNTVNRGTVSCEALQLSAGWLQIKQGLQDYLFFPWVVQT